MRILMYIKQMNMNFNIEVYLNSLPEDTDFILKMYMKQMSFWSVKNLINYFCNGSSLQHK